MSLVGTRPTICSYSCNNPCICNRRPGTSAILYLHINSKKQSSLYYHFAGWCSKRSWNVCVSALHKHGNLFNCNNNDYNYNDHQHDYEPTLYGALFKVKMVHFLSDAIDQYYWLGYYDSFIRFCGEGNCTFDLGWIDRNSLHFIDFGLWNLLYLCIL